MAFDGLMNYAISRELETTIIGGKIDKIFEPNNDEIILGIYNNNAKYALDIVTNSSNYRACLTTHSKANPNFAPNFCMVLRKYLLNTRVTRLYNFGLERIIIIEFEGHNKSGDFTPKKLIMELMGKHSNIILVNSEDIIIDSLKHFDINSNSYRNILPGYKYTLPISDKMNFFDLKDAQEFYKAILEYNSEPNIVNNRLAIAVSNTFTGISKSSILSFETILNLSDILNEENCTQLYIYLQKLLNNIQDVSCEKDEKSQNYFLHVQDFLNSNYANEKLSSLQINFYVDDYYYKKEFDETYNTYKTNFSKLVLDYLKKLNHKLENINAKLQECKDLDMYRIYGELITNNLYRIDASHRDSIVIENFYDNNNLITIPLNKELTPADNAKKFFKKYNKLKNAKTIVEAQKNEAEQEINYLESIVYGLQIAKTVDDIDEIYNEFLENSIVQNSSKKSHKVVKSKAKNQKKNNKNKLEHVGEPIKYVLDGFTILVGKNNKQNDFITKQANDDDIWFHTKDIQGSHVILKTNNNTPSQETINKCAAIAAYYSKAKESSNVSVDYTYVKFVKKPSKVKPGMVVYTNNKNVIVKPNCNIE